MTSKIPQPPARTGNQPVKEKLVRERTYPINKVFDAFQTMSSLLDGGFTGELTILASQGSVMNVVTKAKEDSSPSK
jgi:hypothetical protein